VISPERAARLTQDLAAFEDLVLTECGLNNGARQVYVRQWRRRIRPWLLGQLTADDVPRQTEPGAP
jgi:hypothetical protein